MASVIETPVFPRQQVEQPDLGLVDDVRKQTVALIDAPPPRVVSHSRRSHGSSMLGETAEVDPVLSPQLTVGGDVHE